MTAREMYTKYPVWILYWWKSESIYKDDLDKFRRSIVSDEDIAKKNKRQISSEPLIAAAEFIDKYRVDNDYGPQRTKYLPSIPGASRHRR